MLESLRVKTIVPGKITISKESKGSLSFGNQDDVFRWLVWRDDGERGDVNRLEAFFPNTVFVDCILDFTREFFGLCDVYSE